MDSTTLHSAHTDGDREGSLLSGESGSSAGRGYHRSGHRDRSWLDDIPTLKKRKKDRNEEAEEEEEAHEAAAAASNAETQNVKECAPSLEDKSCGRVCFQSNISQLFVLPSTVSQCAYIQRLDSIDVVIPSLATTTTIDFPNFEEHMVTQTKAAVAAVSSVAQSLPSVDEAKPAPPPQIPESALLSPFGKKKGKRAKKAELPGSGSAESKKKVWAIGEHLCNFVHHSIPSLAC